MDAFVANRNAVPDLMKEGFNRAIKIMVEEHLEKFAREPCPTVQAILVPFRLMILSPEERLICNQFLEKVMEIKKNI